MKVINNVLQDALLFALLLMLCGIEARVELSTQDQHDPNLLSEQLGNFRSSNSRELEETNYGDSPYDPDSTTITNNVQWKDNNGTPLQNGRGGKIAKFYKSWYWVGSQSSLKGQWETGGDIFIYRSTSLGSNSWKLVRKIDIPGVDNTANCQIFRNPHLRTVNIFCKARRFFTFEGGIKNGKVTYRKFDDPSNISTVWKWGNQHAFQHNGQMYMAVSRCRLKTTDQTCTSERKAFIYKLNDSWTDFADENAIVAEWPWKHREALHVIRVDNWWYLFASETKGWRQSRTWYRRAKTLEGLAYATDKMVIMHPDNTENIKSMGTQFRFVENVGNGKFLFGGSRHPIEDPENFDPKYGTHVITPLVFRNGVPHVYWKEKFNWDTYGEYDQHKIDSYGPPIGLE